MCEAYHIPIIGCDMANPLARIVHAVLNSDLPARRRKHGTSAANADADLIVKIADAKTRLSELIARAEAGERVVIARGNDPVVVLTPVGPATRPIGIFARDDARPRHGASRAPG
ncbi:MAG: hypothetical protein AcusKO_43430 [Acuticoccus sp.]